MAFVSKVLGVGLCSVVWMGAALAADSFKVTVRGNVKFARRSTVVPYLVCVDGKPCFKSKPYWVMTVNEDGVQYELNRSFGMGMDLPPSAVSVSGVRISEGSRVRVVGAVQPVSSEYAIMTDVETVELLNTVARATAEASDDFFPQPSSTGWGCRGNAGNGTEYRVQVWFGYGSNNTSSFQQQFHMKLDSRSPQESEYKTVATFENLTQRIFRHELMFDSFSPEHSVALRIRQTDWAIFNLPASLSMYQLGTSPGQGKEIAPKELFLNLRCSPTQLF